MSVEEMKKVIHERVEEISTYHKLEIMLEVLDKLDHQQKNEIDIDLVFEKASKKYGTTLQKLAE